MKEIKRAYGILALIGIFVLLILAWQGNIWLFHQLYPVTNEYKIENITERFYASGPLVQQGTIVSDSGNIYPISSDLFWKIKLNHRYRIEFSYNLTPFHANPVGEAVSIITNITEV